MQRLSVTAAALLLAVSAPAMAQDQTQSDAEQNALSAGEVRAFFNELDRQAQQAVEQKDWQGIQGWISQHVHEEAAIFLKGRFASAEGMAFSYEGTMDGGDLQRFAHMSMGGGMADKMGIENYEVRADVHNVSELATGWASAIVTFHESGTMNPAGMHHGRKQGQDQQKQTQEGEGQQGGPMAGESTLIAFESMATCAFRLARGEGDEVVIRLAACDVSTMM